MLAMLTAFLGHFRGVAGHRWAIGSITLPNHHTSPQIAPFGRMWAGEWWGRWAMRPMREKKLRAMRAMGGRVGAPPPQTAPLSPYSRPHTRPPFRWALVGAGRGNRGAVHRFFLRLQAQFFFFFCATRAPDHIRSADIFVIFFLTALTGFNVANGP